MYVTAVEFISRVARSLGLRLAVRRPVYATVSSLAIAVACFASPSLGASINYLPAVMPGATVDYTNVTEASLTDPVPLFGAPIVSGDSIDFNPVLFNALSQFGGPADLTDGQLTFGVQAHAGYGIRNITLREGGVTTVVGLGTNSTFTDVSAAGSLNILEVDGVGINTISIPINLTFSHNSDGTWELTTDGTALTLPWTGSQFINLNQALMMNNVPFVRGATRISVDLDNALVARSESGTIAFIDKKDFGGLSVTVNIPEPSALILAVVAMLGCFASRRTAR